MKNKSREIEHILFLYPISRYRKDEIQELLQYSRISEKRKKELKEKLIFYETIISIVENWLSNLEEDEKVLIEHRYYRNYTYEQIANKFFYNDRSSIRKRIKSIIKKIERMM